MKFIARLSVICVGVQCALLKKNAWEPGTNVWLKFSGGPKQTNPAGKFINVVAQWADPLFDYWTVPAKWTIANGKHLNKDGQDYFCNASVL